MSKDQEIARLYEDFQELIEKGILTQESATKLREHYGEPDKQSSRNLIFIISAILGSILIGLGIILLFAYNWDEFSRLTRTVITFLPLIGAEIVFGFAYFLKRNSIGWMESTSGFLLLMAGAAIALTGQIYNIGGTLSELLFTWLLISIPLVYIANTVLVFVFYMLLLTSWSYTVTDFISSWNLSADTITMNKLTFLLLSIAVIPQFWRNVDRTRFTAKGNIMGWFFAIAMFLSSFNFVTYDGGLSTLFYSVCLTVLLYAFGKLFYDKTKPIWQKPFQATGIASIYIIAIMCTYEWYWRDFSRNSWFFNSYNVPHRITHLILYIISSVFFAITIFILYKRMKQKLPVNYFPIVLPVIIGTGILISHFWADFTIAIIMCNLYLLGYGIYYIYNGIKLDKTSLVNAGMLFLSILIAVRFFASDAGFLLKGIVFILLGCGFLGVNIFLMKKQKKNER